MIHLRSLPRRGIKTRRSYFCPYIYLLSIRFVKTSKSKNVNKTIRCCLIAAFWVALFLFAGFSGTSSRSTRELETTRRINNSIVYVPETPLEAQQEPFILNTSTHKFHRPTCSEIKMSAETGMMSSVRDIPLAKSVIHNSKKHLGGSLAPARVFSQFRNIQCSPPQKEASSFDQPRSSSQ